MPEPHRDTFYTTQPGKGLWSLLILAFNAARLPLWIIVFIPRGLRQDSRWSWRQALKVRIVRAFLSWASDVEIVTPHDLTPGGEKTQWVTYNAADSKYLTGIATVDPQIKPANIGGTWYPKPPSTSQKPTKVVLHFHGGAYAIGDGRKQDAGFLAKTLIKNSDASHVLCPNYRLASNPGGRFPAALQDAVASYCYLLYQQNISPENIIVGGDSAGGNLTLCFLRYLADHGSEVGLPNPSCAWLWSPWVDPGNAISQRGVFHMSPNAPTDYINKDFGAWGARCYTPEKSTGVTNDSEYINFRVNAFKSEVPLYFSVCESEVLLFDAKESYEKFSKVPGNKTEVSLEPAAPHDILLVGDKVGFEAEAADAVKKANKFYRSL